MSMWRTPLLHIRESMTCQFDNKSGHSIIVARYNPACLAHKLLISGAFDHCTLEVWTRFNICLVIALNNKTCCHIMIFMSVMGKFTSNSKSDGHDMVPGLNHCFDLVPNCMFSHRPNKIATPSRAGGAAMTLLHTVPDESSRNETAQNVAASIKRMV
jgi:hypothetical protein